jgi:hypothetical protein
VYNLIRDASTRGATKASDFTRSADAKRLAELVAQWESLGDDGPTLLGYPLMHQYTETNLSFARLKGLDDAVGDILRTCPKLDLYLTLVTREQRGGAAWCPEDDEDEEDEDEDEEEDDYNGYRRKRSRYGYNSYEEDESDTDDEDEDEEDEEEDDEEEEEEEEEEEDHAEPGSDEIIDLNQVRLLQPLQRLL